MPPQLEKNHVVPTAWQDEALARDGALYGFLSCCLNDSFKAAKKKQVGLNWTDSHVKESAEACLGEASCRGFLGVGGLASPWQTEP